MARRRADEQRRQLAELRISPLPIRRFEQTVQEQREDLGRWATTAAQGKAKTGLGSNEVEMMARTRQRGQGTSGLGSGEGTSRLERPDSVSSLDQRG